MTNITKHYTKKEWECNGSKNRRVHLFISWYAIGISYLLCDCSVLINSESSGRVSEAGLLQSWSRGHS